ncbi:hypothetical protein K2173_014743 [Erythroxylum novogranatense]|uniref:CCHC-type domain-containing protein n=1 Tax=Erythroxylum novogranatense TaxID=1862640 RepID=A0AAV8TFM6_9ROSI|nr:hypothetical protein K2173_014743 [Erythroxylum novogranatense]
MRIHGDKTEEFTIVEKIIYTTTTKFNFVICSSEESHDIDFLSIDELQSSLLIYKQKIAQQDKEEVALNASTDFHGAGRGRGRGNGKGRGRGRGRGNNDRGTGTGSYTSKFFDKSNIECYRCHKFGHFQYECRNDLSKLHGEESNFV